MLQKVLILSKIQDVSCFCNHRKFKAEKRDKCIVAYNKIDQYITSYGPNMQIQIVLKCNCIHISSRLDLKGCHKMRRCDFSCLQ